MKQFKTFVVLHVIFLSVYVAILGVSKGLKLPEMPGALGITAVCKTFTAHITNWKKVPFTVSEMAKCWFTASFRVILESDPQQVVHRVALRVSYSPVFSEIFSKV